MNPARCVKGMLLRVQFTMSYTPLFRFTGQKNKVKKKVHKSVLLSFYVYMQILYPPSGKYFLQNRNV